MKLFSSIARALALGSVLVAGSASAMDIATVSSFLTSADPTQLGRLSRNSVIQDWSGSEAFPGVINPTTSYHYRTYSFNVGITNFIQLDVDSVSALTFFSVYQTTYNAGNLMVNWLGDLGSSGDFFPGDPAFLQVVAALNSTIVVVVNESTTNGGLGASNPFSFLVEGFIDSEFTNPTPAVVPEPSTILLLAPLALVVGLKSRKRRAADSKAPALA